MTVKELIEKLKGLPEDAPVYLEQPTHNHWRNVRATPLGWAGEHDAVYSAYLESLQVIEDDACPEELDGEIKSIVLLAVDA